MKAKKKHHTHHDLNPLASVTRFPSPIKNDHSSINDDEKIDIIADKFKDILETLGLDLTDSSLAKTPHRIAYMYVKEIFSGLKNEEFPPISFVDDKFREENHSHPIVVKANFTSFCEHHFVPMQGVAYVGYIPNKKLIGLSKIPRIVRYFARRPQLQERLTAQIADCLSLLLDTEDVAVTISATHYCVLARGIEDEHSRTDTNVLRGAFYNDPSRRREFFDVANR